MPDGSRAVLVVDDNGANRAIYERVVGEVKGALASCFTDPEAALAWARDNALVLLVVDYHMPKIDGLTFIERFRALPERARVPVVMLTGSDDERVRAEATRLGVVDFMKKPVDRKRLQHYVTHALRKQSG